MATKRKTRTRRPPKSWMRRCVMHVKAAAKRARRAIRSPEAVCGGEWYHKMNRASRARAKRTHRD